ARSSSTTEDVRGDRLGVERSPGPVVARGLLDEPLYPGRIEPLGPIPRGVFVRIFGQRVLGNVGLEPPRSTGELARLVVKIVRVAFLDRLHDAGEEFEDRGHVLGDVLG